MTKKSLTLLALFAISFISTISTAQTVIPGGAVSGVWGLSGSPFLIEGDINIPEDETLSIDPGVEVIFMGDYSVEVFGTILANGTNEDSIYFTTDSGVTWGGFSYVSNPNVSEFYYCLFENADNYPGGYGGVFHVYISDIIVEHCTFQHNRANRGAAMYALWCTVIFRYNVCWDNTVEHCGGAINFGVDSNSIIEKCVFYANSSYPNSGGAIYFWDNHCPVVNCTIVQNSSPAILSIEGTTSEFVNCIFWENDIGFVYQVTYSDIQGGYPGTGNINADPMFVNSAGGDFHLLPGSPCIDAGDPNSPLDPDSTRADMGAYYFNQSGVQGNLSLDLEPVNPPIVIPASGGSFDFTVDISCDPTGYAYFDGWTNLILPDGQVISPLMLRQDRYIGAGETMHFDMELYVSMWAMPGMYEFVGNVGEYPDSVYAFDSFTFEKLEADGAVPEGATAYGVLSGWDEPETFDLPVLEKAALPRRLEIASAPNPFNPETRLRFSLPEAGEVVLTVYDVSGRAAAILLDRRMDSGWHEVSFDAGHLSSGIYLAVLKSGNSTAVERLLLVK